ncbi:MAG: glycosyltransferase, partial [Woeseiaceae bacterium]
MKAATRVVGSLGKVDVVSYHASNRGMYLFGPVIALVCKLARKPVVLRIFGGSFGEYYSARGRLGRYIVRKTVFSADVILIQTKRTMAQLEQHSSGRLVWFATYVQMMGGKPARAQVPERASDRTCKKFVFLGHLWKTKGIDVILDAAALLPGDAGIDIYGPLDEYSESEIETRGQGRVRYCGFLTHGEVEERLADYDCLLLPTFHESEGYPGVIAEAFTCGLPVIATDWLAIPE